MISLVIPAYNEEDRIELALIYSASTEAEEIVVVADGQDKTAEIVETHAPFFNKVHGKTLKLVKSEKRLGKGGAFFRGFRESSGDQVFLVDADFPVPTSFVHRFSSMLKYCDVVIGSRYRGNAHVSGQPFSRKLLSFGFRHLCRLMFHLDVKDYQCGFKAFRREVLETIVPKMQTFGFAFDVELLIRIVESDFTMVESPIVYEHDRRSKTNLRQIIRMFLELWTIKQLNLRKQVVHQYLLK